MAEYTIELRDVIKAHNIFDFPYPFYDEKKRPDFERNFIRHFYFREIGQETVDRFKFYLEDKMNTIFPYYNELFRTAQIEYNILDNYNITEKTTMKRENVGSASGESYAVGKTIDEQNVETLIESSTNETEAENTEVNRNNTDTFEGAIDQTISEDKEKTATEASTENYEIVKRFLDTPQGRVDLSDNKYLTTLGQDTDDREINKDLTENENGVQSTTRGENSTKTTVGKDESTGDRTRESKENSKTNSALTGEHRTSNDAAVRSRSEGATSETVEFTRKGNIGVDTDSDMIQKHIKLQKVLTQIEKMFFDECDDLFMLVM